MHDNGEIFINGKPIEVDDVIKGPNGQHFHHVENSYLINLNDSVDLKINIHQRELTTKNHSTEHLLHKALRELVSKNIKQEGAFKSSEKVTFDFACDYHLSNDQILAIENKVNEYINSAKEVKINITDIDTARKMNAVGHFEEVYKKIGGKLRVVDMNGITCDICGGTHVHNTKDIEQFMITKFYSVGGGMYRIEAITSNETINKYLETSIQNIKQKIDLMNQVISKNNIIDKEYNNTLNLISYEINLNNYHDLVIKFDQLSKIYICLIIMINKFQYYSSFV